MNVAELLHWPQGMNSESLYMNCSHWNIQQCMNKQVPIIIVLLLHVLHKIIGLTQKLATSPGLGHTLYDCCRRRQVSFITEIACIEAGAQIFLVSSWRFSTDTYHK